MSGEGQSLLGGASLFELSPLHVDEGTRIGFLHEDKAAALGRLMAVDGQRDPIKVVANPGNANQPWRLVTGMHRLIGARIEGITVWAIEVAGKPEDLADLEASENLHRRPLAPLERAKFVHALCEAATLRIARQHGDLTQAQIAIKARWDRVRNLDLKVEQALQDEATDTEDKMSAVYGWQESAADAMGLDPRTIRRALRLYRLVIEPFPDLIEALSKHPVVGENDKQLRDIADLPGENQRRAVIEALLADHELSADAARVQVGIAGVTSATPAPYDKFAGQISTGWQRLSLPQKREFVERIPAMLGTDDMKRRLRDLLNKELGE
jgi:ParB family transcriptional regulator, chromosome partitioning protein